jgi:hypothetical protein
MPCWWRFDDLQHFRLTRVVNTIGRLPSSFGHLVDLAHHLVGLVDGVDEGQAHMARLELETG